MKLKRLTKRIIAVMAIVFIVVMQSALIAEARAGGRGGHSSHSSHSSIKSNSNGGGIFRNNRNRTFFYGNNTRRGTGGSVFSIVKKIILMILLIIFVVIIICMLRSYSRRRKKFKEALPIKRLDDKSIETILLQGNLLTLGQLKDRVEEVYFSVQTAWSNRDMTFSREQMSLRLYNEYTERVNEMIREDEVNILEDIKLLDVKLDSVCTDIMNPFIVVKIKGSMIDYWQVYNTKIIKKGKTNKKTKFVEYWKMTVDNNRFVLDEII
ncbi:MAG: hypothetical protein E7214_04555 [Clostridium sp.]|nr:hypothetical protein [Clostridium sp.]